MGFLNKDPGNVALLAEAASAAYDVRNFDLVTELIWRHAAIEPPSAALTNLQGLAAMAQHRFAEASDIFRGLRESGHDDPGLRFNLAWSNAMLGAYRDALDLLDDEAVAASARGPALKIQMMHHLELYEDALACGKALAERYPENRALMGALATLALDAEKSDLARLYAERAGDNAEGSAALGILVLGEHDAQASLALFDRALDQQPENPRAWVGKGLALLSTGDAAEGAKAIDRGAELFGDHLGSWIASGWAHFVAGDLVAARAAFERALGADPNFSESHGGLAVLDILEGNAASAKQRMDIALRLDKNCFSGALAKSLLLERAGDARAAQKIRDIALSTPVGPNGQTIAQALVGIGAGSAKTRGPRRPTTR